MRQNHRKLKASLCVLFVYCTIWTYCISSSLFLIEIFTYNIHIEKNDFVEVFKNLGRYKSENNFVKLSK